MIFELDKVSYAYANGIEAVGQLSFSVDAGERIALLGANGSGKSTILKLLDGLVFSTSGSLSAYGQVLTPDVLKKTSFRNSFRQRVGFVFQDPDVQLFCPTVWEEVTFGPLQLELSLDEVNQRGVDALSLLGILELKDRFPYQLSGGEKKRVALAATLAANPEVLLLDEPTNGLDPRTQKALVQLLWELFKAEKTIISSTNDLSILEDICDRVLVLSEDHRLLAEGSPHDILNDTDLLLKANLIHEHLHKHGDDLHLHRHTHLSDHEHRHFSKEGRHSSQIFKLPLLTCPNCAKLLEHLLLSLEGVEQARFTPENKELKIFFDPQVVSADKLEQEIEQTGYLASG